MLNKGTEKIFFIPGWSFRSAIGDNLSCIGLDYPPIAEPSLTSVATNMAKKVTDNCTIIGWSLGGLLAIRMATLFPTKVAKIILIATTPCFLTDLNWQGVAMHAADLFMAKAKHDISSLAKDFLRLVAYPNKSLRVKSILEKNLAEIGRQQSIWVNYLKILFDSDLRKEYSLISKPILHILGCQDPIIKSNSKDLNLINKGARIITIKQAGHVPFITHEIFFMQTVKEFLHNAD